MLLEYLECNSARDWNAKRKGGDGRIAWMYRFIAKSEQWEEALSLDSEIGRVVPDNKIALLATVRL